MTTARRKQVCLDVTTVYHCVTRCVRRLYLCGYGKLTHRNHDQRRAWTEDRLLLLAEVSSSLSYTHTEYDGYLQLLSLDNPSTVNYLFLMFLKENIEC